jgi:hypothetical protein
VALATTATSTTILDPTSTSLNYVATMTDNGSSGIHSAVASLGTYADTVQVFSIWLARGSGTNNRYVRMLLGNSAATTLTNGIYADIDLQAGTIGSCTAVGTGTATSSSIVAHGTGYICTIIGKAGSGLQSNFCGLQTANALGGVSYTGDTTQCLIYQTPQIFTAASLPSATMNVDADTGWLAGDVIAIATTTRTTTECELSMLASNATTSTLPLGKHFNFQHLGVSPTQAEIINLTRNVKFRSVSTSAMTFFFIGSTANIDVDWVEFYRMGESATGKMGIDLSMAGATYTVNTSFQYCSLHDFEDGCVRVTTSTSTPITKLEYKYLVFWNTATAAGPSFQFTSSFSSANWNIESCTMIKSGAGNGFTINDVGGTFINNTVAGVASTGIELFESSRFGTVYGNISHGNVGYGFAITGASGGYVGAITAWRNNSAGLNIAGVCHDLIVEDLIAFGNATYNVHLSGSGCDVTFKGFILNSESVYTTTYGVSFAGIGIMRVTMDNCDLGSTVAHTYDLDINFVTAIPMVTMRNTKLSSSTEIDYDTVWTPSKYFYISSQKHDQLTGNHVTWMPLGKVATDTSIYNTASPSLRVTPLTWTQAPNIGSLTITNGSAVLTSASGPSFATGLYWDDLYVGQLVYVGSGFASTYQTIASFDKAAGTITLNNTATSSLGGSITPFQKMESAPMGRGWKVAIANNTTATVSCYIYKSAFYNGTQPRLIQRANPALGQDEDVVLATYSAGTESWNQISGITSTATDNGVWEIIVDCESLATGSYINIDDFTVN